MQQQHPRPPPSGYAPSSSSSAAPQRGQTEMQTYSRADLMKLKTKCPKWYGGAIGCHILIVEESTCADTPFSSRPPNALMILSGYQLTFRTLVSNWQDRNGHRAACRGRDSTWTNMSEHDVLKSMGISTRQERTRLQALLWVYDVPPSLILRPGDIRPSPWQILPSQPSAAPTRRSPPPQQPQASQPQQSSGAYMHPTPQEAEAALTVLARRYADDPSFHR